MTAACAFSRGVLALILGTSLNGLGAIASNPDRNAETSARRRHRNAILGSMLLLGMSCAVACPSSSRRAATSAERRGRSPDSCAPYGHSDWHPLVLIGVFVYDHRAAVSNSRQGGGVRSHHRPNRRPHDRRESGSCREFARGALALGAPQWRVTTGVVLPAAASGIVTGAMLAVARVSGETAPLLFTAFGSRFFNVYLDQPMASLTVQIYNYAISPYDEWHAQAWAATLILMTLILVINITVRFFTRQKF